MSDAAFASVREPAAPVRYEKPGQPTKYDPSKHIKLVHEMALLGAKDVDIARAFQIDATTLYNWKREHPEFFQSWKEGQLNADAHMAASLYKKGTGYDRIAQKAFMPAGATEPVIAEVVEHYPPDTAAAIIWLKNRQPHLWRDFKSVDMRVQHEHSINEQTQEFLSSMLATLAEDDSNTLIDASATEVESSNTK